MDMVITSDTAVPHLPARSGADLDDGAVRADWRWLLDRVRHTLVPTARVFRQTQIDDWKSVVAEVAQALSD